MTLPEQGTDTNQASELFELCKEVYELTKWEGTYSVYESFTDSNGNEQCNIMNTDSPYLAPHQYQTPLYTSDYLLEKLPPTIVARGEAFSTATRIAATPKQLIGTEADTPLKALLKLTIALSEAGELK